MCLCEINSDPDVALASVEGGRVFHGHFKTYKVHS